MHLEDIVNLPDTPYKKDLFGLLGMDGVAEFTWKDNYYILCSIERESGCGSSFNVGVRDSYNRPWTLFMRTVD